MIDSVSRVALIFAMVSCANIQNDFSNPMFWVCVISIGVLYVCMGLSKND